VSAPILSVEGLSVAYRTGGGLVQAVDAVSLSLAGGGEALGVIGESGSGKSTLALALMRLLPKNAESQGRIEFEGRDVTTLSLEAYRREVRWRRMAMVFQGAMHALNPVLRVGDQVAERLVHDGLSRREARRRVDELLERVGLPRRTAERYPHELSGGMKQRVMIAMALTLTPGVVILDEPTSALDVSVQAQIMNLLKELKWQQGVSMVFITHDLALASDLCDRVAVMYAGQVRELADADRLLATPLDPYTQGLLASIPRLHDDARPAFLPGAPPDATDLPRGCRFAPRCVHVFEACSEPPPAFEPEAGRLARCWLHAPAADASAL
jgi:oligopeptide/dipeptide ABC transporter ATP-binding protein